MRINNIIIGLIIIGILVVSGCAQQPTRYVCPGGTTVSDASTCPKEQKVTCQDGTQVDDYSQCCFTEQVSGTKHICRDITGNYADTSYCDGEAQVIERHKCEYNRCAKDVSRGECPEWAICKSEGGNVECVAK